MLIALCISIAAALPAPAYTEVAHHRPAWLQDGPLFTFRSGFWGNLHHFLYVLGRARTGAPDSRRAAVAKAPADLDGLAERPEDERAAWDESVHFYAGGPSTKDILFDRDLVEITRKIAAAPDDADPATLGLPRELAGTLKLAAPVYRAVWWPRHSRANIAKRDELQSLIDTHGAAAVKRLSTVYRTQWPARSRVVDISAYSNWAGAYSVTGGVIVISSLDEAARGMWGLEALLHESSHQWDDEIEARLSAIAKAQGKALNPQLSHALIFYTSGEIVAELAPGHEPYAVKNGLWNRSTLAPLKPLLDKYWRPYIRGAGTFEEAAAKLVEAGPQPPV